MLVPHWLVVGALVRGDELVLAELELGLLAAFDAHVLLQAWRLHESRHVLLHGGVGLEGDVLEDPHYGGVALDCAERYD